MTNVLIVDDEPEICSSLAESFKKRGCQTFTANNGIEALRLLETQEVQAIVTDVRMPRMTGLELLDRVKALEGKTPNVLVMSGYADVTLDEVYHRGAEALFHKPFSHRLLVETTMASLLPRDEYWSTPSQGVAQVALLERKFSSLDSARSQKVLSLGRGGMFLSMGNIAFKKDEMVGFHIEFEDGASPLLEGEGTVRWVRRAPVNELPPGCGVEFSYLAKAARDSFAAMLSVFQPRPFIPRG